MYSNNSKMYEWKIIRILIPLGICAMVIGFIALIAIYVISKIDIASGAQPLPRLPMSDE